MTLLKSAIAAALLSASTSAIGHITVWPKTSQAGAHEKYEVRVPNEKQSDTISIELHFPAGLRVMSFEQKPGWLTEAIRDSSGTIVGVRWSGRLAPQEFTEFGLLAINPAKTDLAWPAIQRFADGSRVDWSGGAGSKTPAPHVMLAPAN